MAAFFDSFSARGRERRGFKLMVALGSFPSPWSGIRTAIGPGEVGKKGLRVRREEGQALVLCCLFLAALLGMASLAVDVGKLYLVSASFQRAADAAALAGGSGLVVSQAEATSRATQFANLNLSTQPGLSNGTTTTVTFPTANTVKVTISNPALNLFFGGIIGRPTAPVSAHATAMIESVTSMTGNLVPLAVYCYTEADCEGVLEVGQQWDMQRYCGNFFESGANGSTCGNSIVPGEAFLTAVTFTGESNSTDVFRDEVLNGYAGTIAVGDQVGTLQPGNRIGWQSGMRQRIQNEDREVVLPVIVSDPDVPGGIKVFDLIKVYIVDFYNERNWDRLVFRIIQRMTSTTSFATGSEGYNIDSLVGVRLIE